MDDKTRKELVERVALASVNARRELSDHITSLRSLFHWDQETARSAARAALAVIEPVVREECAQVAFDAQADDPDLDWDAACRHINDLIRDRGNSE